MEQTACSFTSGQCWGSPPHSIQPGSTSSVKEQTLSWIVPCFVAYPSKPGYFVPQEGTAHTEREAAPGQPYVREEAAEDPGAAQGRTVGAARSDHFPET